MPGGARRRSAGTAGFEEEQLTARARGEAGRRERQRRELNEEIAQAFLVALIEPVRAGALAHAHTLASLHWTHTSLTRYIHALATELEWEARSSTPAVCADLRVWAASGYQRLSPATKSLAHERQSLERPLSEQLATGPPDR